MTTFILSPMQVLLVLGALVLASLIFRAMKLRSLLVVAVVALAVLFLVKFQVPVVQFFTVFAHR
ncbi:hypothetical protein [Dictyobacter kobayashii]|uniref:Uncharacterized protein n=1 Tax=Dictyobacter kobayashii TaxID=2014872 RepID=A0A402AMF5_9CHLR|nr:hypothetical protein [Dictyobacter kobayashii]GCE20361.1 hypothetical protein KDK_41610 [Dictyobacter kobayashii]